MYKLKYLLLSVVQICLLCNGGSVSANQLENLGGGKVNCENRPSFSDGQVLMVCNAFTKMSADLKAHAPNLYRHEVSLPEGYLISLSSFYDRYYVPATLKAGVKQISQEEIRYIIDDLCMDRFVGDGQVTGFMEGVKSGCGFTNRGRNTYRLGEAFQSFSEPYKTNTSKSSLLNDLLYLVLPSFSCHKPETASEIAASQAARLAKKMDEDQFANQDKM